MSGLAKEFLFGDALGGEDIGNLDIANVFGVGDLLQDDNVQKSSKKKLESQQRKESFSIDESNNPLPVNESDLNLEVICIQDGEKIYRLSDLLIPIDEKKIRKIESYMGKILTAPEKDKNEKEEDVKKKEKNEKKEIANLIKKSRRNQKYSKVNISYNEKFFDKTVFVDLKNKEDYDNKTNSDNLNNKTSFPTSIDNNSLGKENQKIDYSENITNEILEFNTNFKDNSYSSLYNNSLIDVEKNHNSFFKNKENEVFENEALKEFNLSIKSKINSKLFDNTNNSNNMLTNSNLNNTSLNIFNSNISSSKITNPQNINSPFNLNKTGLTTSEQIESAKKNSIDLSLPSPSTQKINKSLSNSKNIKNRSTSDLIDNLNNSSLFLSNKDFLTYSIKNSNIIQDISSKDNCPIKLPVDLTKTKEDGRSFSFSANKTQFDKYDLFDYIKKKRNRAEGYYNPSMNLGIFTKCYLKSPKGTLQYKEISHLIYDLNDYNMNFEVLNQTDNQNKDQQGKAETNPQNNPSTTEDFFTSLVNNKIKSTHNPPLKIGNSKGNLVTHAKCSYNFTYNKINLTYDDLGDFHRPNFCKWMTQERSKRNFSIVIGEGCDLSNDARNKRWQCKLVTKVNLIKKEKKLMNKNIQYMNAYEIFKDRKKLSLIDGKFCLFEHLDEYPLLISNFGMASKMKKYLYSTKLFTTNASNPNTKLTEAEAKTFNMIGPNGTQIILTPNQKLPLLGQIDQNEIKGINVIDNNMYRAPVFYEKIKENNSSNNISKPKKRYNFLLTLKRSKDGKQSFYIRELEHLYTVAQEEPKVEVYPPQSRQYNNFLKNKIETYTYKLYNEIGYKAGINFKVFTNLFPAVTEQVLKKNFKEMNIEIDKNICYFTKIPNEINQSRITPENICQFESCQFGIYKLREAGIKNLTNADKISYATNKFITQTPEEKQQFLAKVIEEELLTTPWNITQNYLQSKQIKGMLSIKGIGDPSNGNGGYSFLKMPVKSYNENKTLKEEMDVLKSQNKNIKTVTGTDADLRKLSKEEIRIKLIQIGVEETKIRRLTRWARVDLLREKSSKAVELGYEGEITKYARNQRFNTKTQREEYQKNINAVFKKQINYIINNPSLDDTDISIDEEKDNEINQYADYSQSNNNEYYFNDENDKSKKSMAFMRNLIFPNKKKKPSGSLNESFAVPEKSVASKRSAHHNKKEDDKIIKIYNKAQPNSFEEQNIKIKLDFNNVDLDFLKNKSKGKNFDSIYEYDLDKGASFKRKRRDTPEKLYNELIGDIIDYCIRNDFTKLFLQPVKKKDYPDYFEIVKSPMDLGSMKNKTKRSEYKNTKEILDDFDLMIHASELYNGDLHEVTLQARKLKGIAEEKFEESKEQIVDLENKIASEQIESGNNIIIK